MILNKIGSLKINVCSGNGTSFEHLMVLLASIQLIMEE
jgi:hypothetical protein